jgi:hypothetical protein
MLLEQFIRLDPYVAFVKTTGLLEEEIPVYNELCAQKLLLEAATNRAATQYGNCELTGLDQCKYNYSPLGIWIFC